MTIYEVVDLSGSPYDEEVLGEFVHRKRAERFYRALSERTRTKTMLDGSPCVVIRERTINDEAE